MVLQRLKKVAIYTAIVLGGYALVLALAGLLAPCVYEALSPKIGHGFDKYVDRLRWVGVLALLPLWWTACGVKFWSEFGWYRKRVAMVLWALAIVSVSAAAFTGAILIDGGFLVSTTVPDESGISLNVLLLIAKWLFVGLGVAFLEELFFRGILQRIWIKGFGVGLGIWVGAFFYAWLHGRPEMSWVSSQLGFRDGFMLAGDYLFAFPANLTMVSLINLTLLGGTLGLMYQKTHSLWIPIAFHAGVVSMSMWMPTFASWINITLPRDPLIELPITTVLLGLWAALAWFWPAPEDGIAAV